MKLKMTIRRKKNFYFGLFITICYMLIIFLLSNMPYEEQDIKPFLKGKINLNELTLPPITFTYDGQEVSSQNPYSFIEFLLRKAGHVMGYCVLTILLFFTWKETDIKRRSVFILSGLIAIIYAILDEWHQSFVPGRTGHWEDAIIIDGIGVVLGLAFLFISTIIKQVLIKSKG